jgi:hypothetical protein
MRIGDRDPVSPFPSPVSPFGKACPECNRRISGWCRVCYLLLVVCYFFLPVIASHSDEPRRIGRRGNLTALFIIKISLDTPGSAGKYVILEVVQRP